MMLTIEEVKELLDRLDALAYANSTSQILNKLISEEIEKIKEELDARPN